LTIRHTVIPTPSSLLGVNSVEESLSSEMRPIERDPFRQAQGGLSAGLGMT